jgi:phosphatidylglycerophosphate synthase
VTHPVAFVEVGPAGGHAMIAGGLTVLERRVRELAKAGATRVVVAAAPVAFRREVPVPVEWVAPGAPAPDGVIAERGDVLAGVEVVDEASRKRAEWALLRRMNKSYEGPVDALINWRFSMRITRQLARTRLTPNHVTVAAIAVGVLAGLLAMRGSYVTTALAGVLLQLNSILDSCDGELARLRFQYSRLGQWLDNLADDIVDNVFIVGVGVGLGGPWLPLGVAAAGGRVLSQLIIYRDVYRRTGTGDIFAFRYWFEGAEESTDSVYDPRKVTTWLRAMGRRDTFVFVWMLACLVGFPHWVIGHAVIISAIVVATIFIHLWKTRAGAAG